MSKKWHRKGKRNNHHIINKTNGGSDGFKNLISLDEERHNAFHFLFGNLSFQEVAEMLMRAVQMKEGYYNRLFRVEVRK
jgi:hypothetical protein